MHAALIPTSKPSNPALSFLALLGVYDEGVCEEFLHGTEIQLNSISEKELI